MKLQSHQKLVRNLVPGRVYRRLELLSFSKSVDRDLNKLLDSELEKAAPGLYYFPKKTRFGKLPADEKLLVKTFLQDNRFLLFSYTEYNKLGLGLTQLYNSNVVYNYKRHGKFELDGKVYDFRRPTNGFPTELTQEFLLVDLLNNLNSLDEDPEQVKKQIKNNLHKFDQKKLMKLSGLYGKIATKRFLKEIINA